MPGLVLFLAHLPIDSGIESVAKPDDACYDEQLTLSEDILLSPDSPDLSYPDKYLKKWNSLRTPLPPNCYLARHALNNRSERALAFSTRESKHFNGPLLNYMYGNFRQNDAKAQFYKALLWLRRALATHVSSGAAVEREIWQYFRVVVIL